MLGAHRLPSGEPAGARDVFCQPAAMRAEEGDAILPKPQQLSADDVIKLLPRITAWRVDPEMTVCCPRCDKTGLVIIDRSARPYSEWYAVSCAACGLDATLNIALGPPVMGGLD